MFNTLGIIQLERGQSPAASHLGRMLGGKSVLEWVIRRVTDCQRLDAVVAVLADTADERRWAGLVPPDVPVHYSARPDALGQCVDALEHYPARGVMRVLAHNLFLDPVLVDRLVNTATAHVGCDYIGFRSRDGRPAILAADGLFGEWCRADALRRADIESLAELDRDQVTRFIYLRPEEFGVRLIPLPVEFDGDDVRRKLNCAENWELTMTIFDALGPDEWDWQHLVRFVAQPHQRRHKAGVNRSAPVEPCRES